MQLVLYFFLVFLALMYFALKRYKKYLDLKENGTDLTEMKVFVKQSNPSDEHSTLLRHAISKRTTQHSDYSSTGGYSTSGTVNRRDGEYTSYHRPQSKLHYASVNINTNANYNDSSSVKNMRVSMTPSQFSNNEEAINQYRRMRRDMGPGTYRRNGGYRSPNELQPADPRNSMKPEVMKELHDALPRRNTFGHVTPTLSRSSSLVSASSQGFSYGDPRTKANQPVYDVPKVTPIPTPLTRSTHSLLADADRGREGSPSPAPRRIHSTITEERCSHSVESLINQPNNKINNSSDKLDDSKSHQKSLEETDKAERKTTYHPVDKEMWDVITREKRQSAVAQELNRILPQAQKKQQENRADESGSEVNTNSNPKRSHRKSTLKLVLPQTPDERVDVVLAENSSSDDSVHH